MVSSGARINVYIPTERSTIAKNPTIIIIKLSSITGGNSGIVNPPESPPEDFCVTIDTCMASAHTTVPLLFLRVTENSTTPSYPLKRSSVPRNLDKYSSNPVAWQVSHNG